MALKGNLRDFSITQLLNLINLSKKTGTLFVESSSEKISLAFSGGKLAYAHVGNDESNLPSILLSANRITNLQYQVLRERTSQMTDKEIGLLLINAGYGTQDDILNSLQNFYVDIVRRLFTWIEGEFRFETDAFPSDDKITVRLELENLIIEGSRQLREWEQLQEEIPNLDLALQFSEKPGKSIRNVKLEHGRMAGGFVRQPQKYNPADW